jgi:hypothetical protein
MNEVETAVRAAGQGATPIDSTWRRYVLSGLGGPIIWIWYFFRSKRVRSVFGEVSITRIQSWLRSNGAT